MAYDKAYAATRRAAMKLAGVCLSCGSKKRSRRSTQYCVTCLVKWATASRHKKKMRKALGQCQSCGSSVKPCETCRARRAQLGSRGLCYRCESRPRSSGKGTCARCRELAHAARIARRAKCLASGKCIVCGARKLIPGRKTCEPCLERDLIRTRVRQEIARRDKIRGRSKSGDILRSLTDEELLGFASQLRARERVATQPASSTTTNPRHSKPPQCQTQTRSPPRAQRPSRTRAIAQWLPPSA